jgi:hypothetical protein
VPFTPNSAPEEPLAGAVANRSSTLDQIPLKPVWARPPIWITTVPGVGLANTPGVAAAAVLLLLLTVVTVFAAGWVAIWPCMGESGGPAAV